MAYIHTVTLVYPLSFSDICAAYPNVSFSYPPSALELAQFDYAEVAEVEPPALSSNETLIEISPVKAGEAWIQQWSSRPATENELLLRCDYNAFWNALIASPLYQRIRSQACLDLSANLCYTEFMAALSDAKAGRPNKTAIQNCINLLLASTRITMADLYDLQTIMKVGSLHCVYTLPGM